MKNFMARLQIVKANVTAREKRRRQRPPLHRRVVLTT
jgi:hypothetical protein